MAVIGADDEIFFPDVGDHVGEVVVGLRRYVNLVIAHASGGSRDGIPTSS